MKLPLSTGIFATAVSLYFCAASARAQEPPTVSAIRADDYRATADRIIAAALKDDTGYERLGYLCDHVGNRLSGSSQLEQAIVWAIGEMKRDGLDNVHAEPVMVPHWVRGKESAELVSPVKRPLVMLGLGDSIGTGKRGIEADVIVVKTFAELDALPSSAVKGKIVLFNAPYVEYSETVAYRINGASRAAKRGAVAVLVRSITPVALRTPHTGALHYAPDAPPIPAAAVTIEDAEMMARMQARKEKIRVLLRMDARMLPDALSANVIADVAGRDKPNEVLVVGGHFDSWDVGQGAMDDGGGCLAAWEAVRLLKSLGLRPRRTVRVVLFTNEENGARGGAAYAAAHKAELKNHVLVIESDAGVTQPTGLGLSGGGPAALATVREVGTLLKSIGADAMGAGGGGTDIEATMQAGVPGMGLSVDTTHYFDIHHTPADTFDKINPDQFKRCVATLAVMLYVIAEMPERFAPPQQATSR